MAKEPPDHYLPVPVWKAYQTALDQSEGRQVRSALYVVLCGPWTEPQSEAVCSAFRRCPMSCWSGTRSTSLRVKRTPSWPQGTCHNAHTYVRQIPCRLTLSMLKQHVWSRSETALYGNIILRKGVIPDVDS